MEQLRYGIKWTVELPWEQAVERTTALLREQGFGVLTEIDLKAKLAEKLGVEVQPYVILGACNPPLAHRALEAEKDIGLLLPCNVIVYATGERSSVVAALDPGGMVEMTGNPALASVAEEAKHRLIRALGALG
jgi:uncharacterized protein (DUF302 family)